LGLRLSASQLSRALKCSYPYRIDVDAGPEEPVGRAAHTGVGFALLREYAVEPERFDAVPTLPPQAQLDVLYKGGRVRAERLVERWLHWWKTYSAGKPGLKWESEIPFAFDPRTGVARRLLVSEHRAYEGVLPHEYVGTADMIGIGSKYIVVLDEKTGQKAYVTPARDNPQLRFLSLCLSIITGIRVGKVGLVFPHLDLDDLLDEVPLTEAGIDAARAEFMELPSRIATSRPVIGDWCTFCPLKKNGTCPSWIGTEDIFGKWVPRRLSAGAVSSPPMARIRTKPGNVGGEPTQPAPEAPTAGRPAVGRTRKLVPEGPQTPEDNDFAPKARHAAWDAEFASARVRESLARDGERPQTPEDNEFAPKRGLRPRKSPELTPDFEHIVERVYQVDALKEYNRLEAALRVGERRTDRGALNFALDEAENNARLAHALYISAVLERARWEADAEIIMAPVRSIAVAELEKDKRDKIRTKDITDADVRAKMAALHPDEFKDHKDRSAKIKGMEDQLKRIADLWQSRCSSLRTMMDKVR